MCATGRGKVIHILTLYRGPAVLMGNVREAGPSSEWSVSACVGVYMEVWVCVCVCLRVCVTVRVGVCECV